MVDHVKLRPAQADDTELLAALFLSAMRTSITAARGYWDPEKEEVQFRQQLDIANTRVVEADGVGIGFVTTHCVSVHLTQIDTLCLALERQRAGIGTCIVRELMQSAEVAGGSLELFVLTANAGARALYARLGFAEVEQSSHHVRMRWTGSGPRGAAGFDESGRAV